MGKMKLIIYDEFIKDEKESLDIIKECFKGDPAAAAALEWVELTLHINLICNLIELEGEKNENI